MKKLFMLVGCPGTGKTWVANQMKDAMNHIPHDNFLKNRQGYLNQIAAQFKDQNNKKPILIETPFSVSQLREPLEQQGIKVECVYIQEPSGTIENRYFNRDGKTIPQGHLTRQETYKERAKESGSFFGTSQQVLDYLKNESSKGPEGET